MVADLCNRIGMMFEIRKPFLPEEIWIDKLDNKLYLVDVYQANPWLDPGQTQKVDHFEHLRNLQ